MKKIILTLSFLAATGPAIAADVTPPVTNIRPSVAVLPAGYNWSGIYIGVVGGGGWSTSQGVDFKGGFAGGTVGVNAQFSNFVLGGEIEGAWSDIGQTETLFGITAKDTIQAFGSAAIRAGVAFDNVLFYGRGGFAAASNNLKVSNVGDTQTHLGVTAGTGVEYGFLPNWSTKIEYLWAHYQSKNYFASLLPPGLASGTFDVHTVKLGVNYRFNWGGTVTSKY